MSEKLKIETMKIKTVGLAEFKDGGLAVTWLPSYDDTESIAKIILELAMREEGKKFNPPNRVKYLEEWADVLTENAQNDGNDETYEAENIADYVADHLIWSSGLYIIDKSTRSEVGSEIKEAIYGDMVNVLESSFETA